METGKEGQDIPVPPRGRGSEQRHPRRDRQEQGAPGQARDSAIPGGLRGAGMPWHPGKAQPRTPGSPQPEAAQVYHSLQEQ